MPEFIEFQEVSKVYQTDEIQTAALDNASFYIKEAEFCVILGPSGAGKTTVINILGGIDRSSSGKVFVGGEDIAQKSDSWLTDYRRRKIGFGLQFYNLVKTLTAFETVELASEISKYHDSPKTVLESMGLKGRMHDFPSRLSGGEQQRVAIARALVKKPSLLLCDEPTGALDAVTGQQILKLIQSLSRDKSMTVMLITHNLAITQMATKIIRMRSGRIIGIEHNAQPKSAEDILL